MMERRTRRELEGRHLADDSIRYVDLETGQPLRLHNDDDDK